MYISEYTTGYTTGYISEHTTGYTTTEYTTNLQVSHTLHVEVATVYTAC